MMREAVHARTSTTTQGREETVQTQMLVVRDYGAKQGHEIQSRRDPARGRLGDPANFALARLCHALTSTPVLEGGG